MIRALLVLGMAVLLASCAHHRDPLPIPLKQAGDESLECDKIMAEYCTNIEVAKEKIKKNQQGDTNDVLLAIFVWPGLADFKNADGTEGNALLDRCIWLKNIAVQKGCDVSKFPELPERYK